MINGLEGIPGSGKSYESVVYHVLAALKSGRKVITNLPLQLDQFGAIDPAYPDLIEIRRVCQPILGVWDSAAAGQDKPAFVLHAVSPAKTDEQAAAPSNLPPVTTFPFGSVWDFYTTWKRDDGRGPLFVIDECHVAMPKIGTSREVIEWFKIHRHFNCDVLLMTQSFRDMDQSIAGLIAILVKVRKADILGDKNSYIRKVHGGYRGAVISTETRAYKPQFFPLYKSHTQGGMGSESEASDVAPFVVKFRRFQWAVWAVGIVSCIWAFWPAGDKVPTGVASKQWYKDAQKQAGKPLAAVAEHAEKVKSPEAAAEQLRFGGPGASVQPSSTDGVLPEPFGNKGLHLLGRMQSSKGTVSVYSISQNGQVVSRTTDAELIQVGYKVAQLNDCVGTVQWGKLLRVVTCDSPSIQVGVQPRAPAPPAGS